MRNEKGQFVKGFPHNKGRIVTDEHRKNLSKAHTGIKMPPFSKQHKERLSKANIGKKPTSETLKKLRESHLGQKAWNKGKFLQHTPELKRIRRSHEYALWRKAVKERDKHTCIWCGSKDNLQADHIRPFINYPELRFAIDNGRTLCVSCHKATGTWGLKARNS